MPTLSFIAVESRRCLDCPECKSWENYSKNKREATGHQSIYKNCIPPSLFQEDVLRKSTFGLKAGPLGRLSADPSPIPGPVDRRPKRGIKAFRGHGRKFPGPVAARVQAQSTPHDRVPQNGRGRLAESVLEGRPPPPPSPTLPPRGPQPGGAAGGGGLQVRRRRI